jgi:hypothetical protein
VPVSTLPDFSAGVPRCLFSNAVLDWGYCAPVYDVSLDGHRFILPEPAGPIPKRAIWIVQNWFEEFRRSKTTAQ